MSSVQHGTAPKNHVLWFPSYIASKLSLPSLRAMSLSTHLGHSGLTPQGHHFLQKRPQSLAMSHKFPKCRDTTRKQKRRDSKQTRRGLSSHDISIKHTALEEYSPPNLTCFPTPAEALKPVFPFGETESWLSATCSQGHSQHPRSPGWLKQPRVWRPRGANEPFPRN